MHHLHTHQTAAPATEGRTIRWAAFYDAFVKVFTLNHDSALRDASIAAAPLKAGDTVLDVGCGTGELTLRARARVGQEGTVYGIDAAPEMIEVARRKAAKKHLDVKFQPGVIEALDFPDNTFDVVLSSLMFHHLPDTLKTRALQELYRVLKPGGQLLIVDFNNMKGTQQHLGMLPMLHMMRGAPDLDDLLPLVQKMGFEHIETGMVMLKWIGYIRASRSM